MVVNKRRTKNKNPKALDFLVRVTVIAVSLLSCLLLFGVGHSLMNIFVARNPYFLLDKHKLKVSVNGELTDLNLLKSQLEKLLAEEEKRKGNINLEALDFGRLRYAFLALNPQVETVVISAWKSNGLKVEVIDKHPVARLYNKRGMIVTESLYVLQPVKKNLHLPVITGIKNSKSIQMGEVCDNSGVKSAVKLLNLLSTTNYGMKLDVSLVVCSSDLTLQLLLNGADFITQNCKVIISRKYMKKDLSRVCLILDTRADAGKKTSFIDASQRTFVPVKPRYRD
jgi:hypothetical protein